MPLTILDYKREGNIVSTIEKAEVRELSDIKLKWLSLALEQAITLGDNEIK